MESEKLVILESCGEDSILVQTMKNMVTENSHEVENQEEFFVVTEEQAEQQSMMEVSNGESLIQPEEQTPWLNLCRICANSNDHLIPIFEGEGLQHDLCSKLHKYLPIHVSKNDTLPLHLCYHCAATLLAWHELLEGCLSAERKLMEMQEAMQEKQNSERLETSTSDTCVSHATPHTDSPHQQQETVKDELCEEPAESDSDRFGLPQKKSFAEYCSWRMTTMRANDIMKTNIACIGSQRFDESNTEENLNEEMNKDNSLKLLDACNSTDLKTVNGTNSRVNLLIYQYICKTCQRSFKRECHLRRHISKCRSKLKHENVNISNTTELDKQEDKSSKNESNRNWKLYEKCKRMRYGTYPCMYCDYTAKKKKLLEIHLKESHPEFVREKDKKLRCADRELVMRARIEVDGKVYYHCNECGKNLHSPYTFSWHVRIHTGERPYTCHLCGKQFRVNQGLARHLRDTHAGIKNFPCDICSRMFTTKRNMEDHRRIHTGERPYVCNVCGKSFKQKASLFVHNRTHSDVFPYKCNYCDQSFRTRPPLRVHITKHTGEKPHTCDICGRCFRIKYELKRHRLIHFDEKPYQCTECNLSFRQKRYLVNHRKINHNTNLIVTDEK